eukprot:6386245-Amphidinium_carterae.1
MGPHRDLECHLLSFPRCGQELTWVKAHTDGRTAAVNGVSELDRQGNAQADGAAQQVLGAVDGRQTIWQSYR